MHTMFLQATKHAKLNIGFLIQVCGCLKLLSRRHVFSAPCQSRTHCTIGIKKLVTYTVGTLCIFRILTAAHQL